MAPLPHLFSSLALARRQTVVAVPATYSNLNTGPPPGTVVGIVIGSVCGFLLLLWLLYTCFNGTQGFGNRAVDTASSVEVRNRESSRRSRTSRRTSRRQSETAEVRRPPVVERVIIEERRPPPARAASVARSVARSVVRSEVSVDDEVVVIEEHSPPPPRRSKSKRESREVRETRESGYRAVDPMAYGGGDAPLRDMGRRGSSRR